MATTEQFSLRWNNFHSNLTAGFHELLESSEMVDVTLAVEGHFFQAHKVVLSICSPYFKQMFKVNPCKHPIVIFKDVAYDNMKDILEFMYMGEVNVLRENLASFLRTAELLQVKGLTGDDSSDTSSRKDDKSDSIPDEDSSDLGPFPTIDSDIELTPAPPLLSTHYTAGSIKRPSKISANPLPNQKRAKPTETTDDTNNDTPINDTEDTKDNLKKIFENNFLINETEQGCRSIDPTQSLKSTAPQLQTPPTTTNHRTNATYQCDKCVKKFSRRDHLRTHEKNIHGEDAGPFACVICAQLYKNAESLRKHIAKFHFPKMNELNQKVEVNA